MTARRRAGTGPNLADPARAAVATLDVDEALDTRPSDAIPNVSPDVMTRAGRVSKQHGPDTDQRVALLGILLAELRFVPFEDVATLLAVKPERLVKMMHGEEQVPSHKQRDWELLAQALHELHRVLRPEATGRWLRTEIPALSGQTPLRACAKGQLGRVANVVRAYLDPSFA